MPLSFQITAPPDQAGKWASALKSDLARAASAAVREAGETALKDGRADIAAAGLSRKWQSALRLDVFPQGQDSINAAAVIRHKIPYAGVFEDGAVIGGNPLLWLPIERNLPVRSGGRRWTPSKYAQAIGPLVSLRGRGNRNPLLGGRGRDGKVKPLFVGVGAVNIRKRFSIRDIAARAINSLGGLLQKHLSG